jgi:hypothetical protein
MARAIDSKRLYDFLTEQLVKETGMFSKGVNKGLNIARSALRNEQITPTFTPPNEPTYLCDLCMYNPPSSLDGKPCTYCPATIRPPKGDGKTK